MSKKCFWCREPVDRVALVDLVYTWEPFRNDLEDNSVDELKEVPWHKVCYNAAQQSVHPTAAGGSTSDNNSKSGGG